MAKQQEFTPAPSRNIGSLIETSTPYVFRNQIGELFYLIIKGIDTPVLIQLNRI
jgi:hypothetical protein